MCLSVLVFRLFSCSSHVYILYILYILCILYISRNLPLFRCRSHSPVPRPLPIYVWRAVGREILSRSGRNKQCQISTTNKQKYLQPRASAMCWTTTAVSLLLQQQQGLLLLLPLVERPWMDIAAAAAEDDSSCCCCCFSLAIETENTRRIR